MVNTQFRSLEPKLGVKKGSGKALEYFERLLSVVASPSHTALRTGSAKRSRNLVPGNDLYVVPGLAARGNGLRMAHIMVST